MHVFFNCLFFPGPMLKLLVFTLLAFSWKLEVARVGRLAFFILLKFAKIMNMCLAGTTYQAQGEESSCGHFGF